MYEHLPEVFAFNIEELACAQRPIKRQRNHVIPPNVGGDGLVGVAIPEKNYDIIIII